MKNAARVSVTAAPAPTDESPFPVDVSFRPARKSDTAIVNSAFLRGLRESSYTYGLDSDTFFSVARQAWRGITRDFKVTIAHAHEREDEVAGYIVHERDGRGNPAVAWLYVAKAWRRFGIGRQLLAQAGVVPASKTAQATRFAVLFASPQKLFLFRSKGYQPAFLPFLCWRWLNASTMGDATPEPPRPVVSADDAIAEADLSLADGTEPLYRVVNA